MLRFSTAHRVEKDWFPKPRVAGEEGIEPSYAGSKDPCLTTWRLPITRGTIGCMAQCGNTRVKPANSLH